jgi:hypothetical protein
MIGGVSRRAQQIRLVHHVDMRIDLPDPFDVLGLQVARD